MTDEEKLDLSPWAKCILYRKFPFKLTLHILLCILTTTHVTLINAVFDSYSRSVGAAWPYLFFPPGYQSAAERNMGAGYELYTINDTLSHAQHLVDSYYGLPYTAVDSIAIYDVPYALVPANKTFFKVPTVAVTKAGHDGIIHAETDTYPIYNATSGWPLAAESAIADAVRDQDIGYLEGFFNDIVKLKFSFDVQTDGVTNTATGTYYFCVYWTVSVEYDLGARGQIMVTIYDEPQSRCDTLPITTPLQMLSLSILVLSILYSTLLIKATFHHIELLKRIYRTQSLIEKKRVKRDKKHAKKVVGQMNNDESESPSTPLLAPLLSTSPRTSLSTPSRHSKLLSQTQTAWESLTWRDKVSRQGALVRVRLVHAACVAAVWHN